MQKAEVYKTVIGDIVARLQNRKKIHRFFQICNVLHHHYSQWCI